MMEADAPAIVAEKPARRSSRRSVAAAPSHAPKSLTNLVFPGWARLAPGGAAFSAGVGLTLLDQVLRDASFGGALRRRLALRAAAAAAKLAGLREDETALRDALCLAAPGAAATSPGGSLLALWRNLARRPALDGASLAAAAALLELPARDWAAVAATLPADAEAHPLAAAAQTAARLATGHARADMLALWASDIVLAERLKWDAPLPLAMIGVVDPALRRGGQGRRPWPSDPDWAEAYAGAIALAAPKALALAGELARRAETLHSAAPRLRARSAKRVIALLLDEDAVSAARASRDAGLTDRAARRLFDRLTGLGAARELTGRPNFRLYGL